MGRRPAVIGQENKEDTVIMRDYMKIYEEWLTNPYFDEATKAELRAIADNEEEIKERFYMDLEFGTAGLRGIIGAGVNRMNIYVVRRATQGLANYIIKQGGASRGVAIAYDSRRMSPGRLPPTALRHTSSSPCARRRSCPSRFVNWAASPVSM